MTYKESLEKVVNMYGFGIFYDKFLFRSIMLDYIGNSLYDTKLVDVFLKVNLECNLYNLFNTKGLVDARKHLSKEIYPIFKDSISVNEFKDSINPLAYIMFKDEYNESKAPPKNDDNATAGAIVHVKRVKNVNNTIAQSSKPNTININQAYQNLNNVVNPFVGVKKVVINLNGVSSADIMFTKDKKAYFTYTRSKLRGSKKMYLVNGSILTFNISLNNEIAVIYLPVQNYDSIIVNSSSTNIAVSKILSSNISVTTVSGSIAANTNSSSITLNTVSGSIYYYGSSTNVKLNTTSGKITFNYVVKASNNLSITANTISGKIYGSFERIFLKDKITPFLKTVKNINTKILGGNYKINLSLNTSSGAIKIYQ